MAKRAQMQKVHERIASELPMGARVAIAIVDDPYSSVGEKIQVIRSVRDDILASMHAKKQIDEAQLSAGRMWQQYHERAEIGHIKAIDPGKEAVDGGNRIPEPITDHQIRAMRKLDEAHKWLGRDGYQIVYSVLGERRQLKIAAEENGFTTARELDYFSRRFKECLEALAELWGYA